VLIGFWWANLREGDHLEDQCIDRRIIFKWFVKKSDGECMERIDLAQDRDSWHAFLNAVVKLQVP
jgi:hypothetical protein